jgi:hypothetical protein
MLRPVEAFFPAPAVGAAPAAAHRCWSGSGGLALGQRLSAGEWGGAAGQRAEAFPLVAQSQSVRAAHGDHADQTVGLSPRDLPSLAAAAAGAPQAEPASSIRHAFFHLVAKGRTKARRLFLDGEGQICAGPHWLPREKAQLPTRNQQLIWGSAARVIVL